MYSFSYPYGLLKHINKSGFLHFCFVEGLEVVHKLLEKKGQALKECFGKISILGRDLTRFVYSVREFNMQILRKAHEAFQQNQRRQG